MGWLTFRRNESVATLAAGLVLILVGNSGAQDVRVETQQQARTRAQNVIEQEQPTEEIKDSELGEIKLVQRAPRPKMFTIFTLQSFNYTTNAFLVPDGVEDDFYWNGRLGAMFIPYATRDFTPRLIFTQEWYRYDRFSDLDFDAQNLTLDVKYDLNHEDTWFINGSYSVSRLYSPDDSVGEFYRYGFLNASVTHLIQLQTSPVGVGLTGGSYWRHGDPSDSDRISFYFNVAAFYNITDTVQVSGFTRPEYQHYTHDPLGSREDVNVTVGATISWTPNQYFALAATASYIGNYSTIEERKYDLVTPSFILGAQFAF